MKYKFYEDNGQKMVEIKIDDHNSVCRLATDQDYEDAKACEPEVELKTTGIVPDDPRPSRQPYKPKK